MLHHLGNTRLSVFPLVMANCSWKTNSRDPKPHQLNAPVPQQTPLRLRTRILFLLLPLLPQRKPRRKSPLPLTRRCRRKPKLISRGFSISKKAPSVPGLATYTIILTSKRLKKACKAADCKWQGKGPKTIKVDEILEPDEFDAIFKDKAFTPPSA